MDDQRQIDIMREARASNRYCAPKAFSELQHKIEAERRLTRARWAIAILVIALVALGLMLKGC